MTKAMLRAGLAACAMVLAWQAAAQEPAVPVTVQADRPGAKIERDIFGQFAEHLGTGIYGGVWVGANSKIPNVRGIRSDVVAALKAIRVPNVRWPGGCYADEYHWRDGIGPQAKRTRKVNAAWGNAPEPNSFGTHEFMDFAQQVGAEAYVSVNIGSGTVKEAVDWVEYMTGDAATTSAGAERAANGREAPWKVKFLGIGNESWSCGGAMTPDFYTDQMKLYARFIRNYHPDQREKAPGAMRRIAVGPGTGDTAYTEAVMKAWKAHDWAWNIEGLSLHNYTTGGWPVSYSSTDFGEKEYATLVKETLGMDGLIAKHSEVMDKYDPSREVALAVDEWGVWAASIPGTNPGFLQQQNTVRDAVIAALNFNIFARHADRVRVANIAQMVNVLQSMILTDGPKMVLTPTYWVHKLYLPFQDATVVPVDVGAGVYRYGNLTMPRVDAVAARATDGKLYLSLVNLDPTRPATIEAKVAGVSPTRAAGEVLTGPAVNSLNSFAAPDVVKPRAIAATVANGAITVTLPPASVTMLAVE